MILIIISKPNKSFYNILKIFQHIVLFNIIEKLIKNILSNRIQVHLITLNFIYPNQIDGIKQQSTTDTSIVMD